MKDQNDRDTAARPEPCCERRTVEEKARILAHLTLQLAAIENQEVRADGHA